MHRDGCSASGMKQMKRKYVILNPNDSNENVDTSYCPDNFLWKIEIDIRNSYTQSDNDVPTRCTLLWYGYINQSSRLNKSGVAYVWWKTRARAIGNALGRSFHSRWRLRRDSKRIRFHCCAFIFLILLLLYSARASQAESIPMFNRMQTTY